MKKLIKKLSFPVIGLLSLIWFLVRVVPKPSRARYPCMKIAAPVAASFVIYLIGLVSSLLVFKKAKQYLYKSKYVVFSILLLLGSILFIATLLSKEQKVYAQYRSPILEGPNQPMGEGKGINPGRVAWIWNPDATDENCTNSSGDYWYQEDNTNQEVVETMLSNALQMLTGEETDSAAWNAIFHHYNQTHERGDVGYTSGEKIVIKINLNSSANYGSNTIDTSPHITLAILKQLINVVGAAEENISIGDPGRTVTNLYWDKCHSVFSDVNYWGDYGGRTPIVQSDSLVFFTSDGEVEDWLPECYLEAGYMINIAVFKKHHRAGISLSTKNHLGSFVKFNGDASHYHYTYPSTEGDGNVDNGEYGVYRNGVDFMAHEHLGGKTIIYIVDGIWGSTNWGHPPIKWRMAPFNNDWPSSIFVSQDPVAIESVGFDFLYNEFDEDHPTEGTPGVQSGPFPRYAGVDDFLHQAADSANWTDDIPYYDPEGDGTPIPWSLGVHEHWNNSIEMKYSRNLGEDEGIELLSNYDPSGIEENIGFPIINNDLILLNSSTTIQFAIPSTEFVTLEIYNNLGRKIETLVNKQLPNGNYSIEWNAKGLADGIYFYRLRAGKFCTTNKIILLQ
ncbi:DUF362 domain-containing protein [candidate division WOR-3 bacterium]|nr:DUF362 domain-containing protein [candidate division WOR-3 bacterium]